jgi:hypothetical protein
MEGLAVEIVYKGFTLSTADDTATTKIMLNSGSKASNFARAGRDIGDELAMCQRYFEKSYEIGDSPGTPGGFGGSVSFHNSTATNDSRNYTPYKVTKRVSATANFWNPVTGAANSFRSDAGADIGGGVVSTAGSHGFKLSSGSVTVATLHYHYAADAEL